MIKECLTCGKEFKTIPSRIKLNKGKFCSKKCFASFLNKKITKVCLTCYNKFIVKRNRENTARYCSVKCYDKSGNKNPYWGKKHSDKVKEKMKLSWDELKKFGFEPHNKQNIYKKCIICGQDFKVIKSRLREACCCSIKCKKVYCSVYIRGKMARNWIDGRSYLPYSSEFNKLLKNKIKERDNYVCRYCNSKENLSVHHIDYNKNNCLDSNLITLCLTCNSLANGNRDFWKNYYYERIKNLYEFKY